MALGRRKARQKELFISTAELARGSGPPCYTKLNAVLAEDQFDAFVENLWAPCYKHGHPARFACPAVVAQLDSIGGKEVPSGPAGRAPGQQDAPKEMAGGCSSLLRSPSFLKLAPLHPVSSMRLASVLTPLNDYHLTLAAQCGVEDITVRYPGPDPENLLRQQRQIQAHGLRLAIVEGYLPIERLKLGRDDGSELAAMKSLIHQMGKLGIPILCYNFMAGTDWVRTRLDAPERGGARVTEFNLAAAERAVSLSATASTISSERITSDELWANLERMLRELVPVAEECGVFLAMHPDDPPLPEFQGKARIMNSVENFERLVRLVPSGHNGICFCQGTFAAMGVDIPATIRRLGPHIRYVHFRDVRATSPGHFVETFHDNGPTDMVAAMAAYREAGFAGPMRPDHVPQLIGEEHGEAGYTMLGRLFAYGYMRGLMQSAERFVRVPSQS